MFAKLINALLGAFGVIKREKKFDTSHNEQFVQEIPAGAVILTGARHPNFIQGGIQGATDSYWQHAELYVGQTVGQMVRSMFPDLIKNLAIPLEAQQHEIVTAQGEGIKVSTLNLSDKDAMTAFYRPLSTIELMKILHRIYSNVGKPYDVLEFVGDALPDAMSDIVPNKKDYFCCASLVADAYLPVEKIVRPKVDITRATPKNLYDYLFPLLFWKMLKYNW
jgi:hypothetical protein